MQQGAVLIELCIKTKSLEVDSQGLNLWLAVYNNDMQESFCIVLLVLKSKTNFLL